MADQESEIDKIKGQLKSLELRIRRLESALAYSDAAKAASISEQVSDGGLSLTASSAADTEDKGLESQIGRFGLAWMGNIVLIFGITFLSQYLMNLGHHVIAVILGYLAAASIYALSGYLKKSNGPLSFMFRMNAQILLFYVTLRLHFFSAEPLIINKIIVVILLVLVVALTAYISIHIRSQAFGVLALFFALVAAVLSDSVIFIVPLIIFTAAGGMLWLIKYDWRPLSVVTVIFTYATFFIWILGDPLMGHAVHLITQKYLSVACLLSLGTIYSLILLTRKDDSSSDDFLIGLTITNGVLFTIMLFFIVLSFFSTGYVLLFTGITLGCLAYSVVLHSRSEWNFASAFYALYGFMAMSIALYGMVGFPKVYLLLSVQSLIVVSMALWFRNRLIVIMNSLLFMLILAIYLITSKPNDGVNFSFALAALISARVINWQSTRLQIKTDLLRNLYMIEGFIMVLFSLIHAVPKQFVTLSWTMGALVYFLLSILLKNVKYRYMALGTMICAAFYLFIVDLARIEIVYRVLALLFLAAISIGISIYYTNRIKKSDN
jgi:hypothetical protein